jgi:hypothetical protein
MQKTLVRAALVLVAIQLVACTTSKHSTTKRLSGVWQAQPVTADGSNKDWPSAYPDYDSKASLGYAVSNDKENLYIRVETGDQATQMKILRNGLTVWIDKTGAKELITAINYPIPRSFTQGKSNKREGEDVGPSDGYTQNQSYVQRINREDRIRTLMEEAKEFSLQGFRHCNSQFSIIQKDSCGIEVRIGLDETTLVWEAVIPFKTFYPKAQIDKRDKGKILSICIETTGSERPAGAGSGGRGSGGGMRPAVSFGLGGMGIGTGSMGSRGGNYAGTRDNSMESLYKSTETWKKFGIAWQE